jgi:general L-amino acid transport system permease protein
MADSIVLPDTPEAQRAPEPPPHGPVVWMRVNLFSTPMSAVLTFIGGALAVLVVRGLVGFVFGPERQWEAVTTNMRLLMVQAYPPEHMWRTWASIGIVVVLLGLSLAVWRVGGRVAPRRLLRVVAGIGAFLLFATLIAGAAFDVVSWIIDAVTGGDAPFDALEPFSASMFVSWTVAGLLLVAVATGIERGLGGRSKSRSLDSVVVAFVALGVIVASVWVIEVPVPDPEAGIRVSRFEGIAGTTTVPWSILFVVLVVSWLVGRVVRDRLPEAVAKRTLALSWTASFPFIVLHLTRSAQFQEVGSYLTIGLGFAIAGAALLWFLAGDVGELGRGVAGLVLVLAVASWALSALILVRLMLLALALFALAAPTFGGGRGKVTTRYLVIWVAAAGVITYLMLLAVAVTAVDTPNETPFGGFLLTWILAIAGIGLAFPLGVLLALGRTSTMPIFRLISTVYIELVRGVPLITWLLISVVVFPIFFPLDTNFPNVIEVIAFITFFSAAYLAENVRGGLQAIPNGQTEAANALGMTTLQRTVFITLPQALRAVIPALVGQVIAIFKDTSLVAIVGLFDLLRIARNVIPNQSQPFNFLGSLKEDLVAAALLYWIFTFTFSRISQRIERKLGVGER